MEEIKISPLDREFSDKSIKKVRKYKWKENSYEVTFDDGWCLIVQSPNFKPKPGMKAREYGEGIGRPVRGLVINDKIIYYRTKDEEKTKEESDIKEWQTREYNEAKRNLPETNKIIGSFPPEFKARIQRFRQKPDFWWKYEPYEISVCVDAIKIAKKLKTESAIEDFSRATYKKQRKMVPNLSKDHSGNSFGMAVNLARLYISKPHLVREAHGSLAFLVGSKEYAPNKYGV